VNGLTHFSHELPSYVSSAEHGRGWIGQLLRRLHLQALVTQNAPKLHTLGNSLARLALTVGKGAVSLLAELGTVAALVVLFLLEGPKLGTAVLRVLPPERSERYVRVAVGSPADGPVARRPPGGSRSAASTPAVRSWYRSGQCHDSERHVCRGGAAG